MIRWKPGPESREAGGPWVVSVTEFRFRRLRHLPGIFRAGMGFRRRWGEMPGAVGLALYFEPGARRLGSISVWRDEADLRRFVALPVHVAIMRRYRPRGTVRSATWRGALAPPAQALERARAGWAGAGD
jgi:hypothetical protein